MIKKLVITEKATKLNEENCYVFLINDYVNKIELKKYIEKLYKVKVIKINTLKKLGKKVRRGKALGKTSDCKKAYVFTSDKISVLEEAS